VNLAKEFTMFIHVIIEYMNSIVQLNLAQIVEQQEIKLIWNDSNFLATHNVK